MTRFLTATLFTLLLAGGMQSATAQIDIGPRVGYDLEFEELHLGAEARFAIPGLDFPILIKPSVDYYLADEIDLLTIDINGIYEIDFDGGLSPYVGAGIGISRWSLGDEFEGIGIDASSTDTGLNVIGGAVFDAGSLRPFAEARFSTEDLFTISGGLLFSLGG